MLQNMAPNALNVAHNAPKCGTECPKCCTECPTCGTECPACGAECPVVFTDVLNYIPLNSQYDRETDSVPNTQFTIIFKSYTLFFLTPLFDTVHVLGLWAFCVPV